MLVEAAWSSAKSPGPLRAFAQRTAERRGRHVATVAVARKLAVLSWHLLTRGEDDMRERHLAQQAEAIYRRQIADWQASRPKAGAGATPGRASQRPSKGKAARQAQSP